MEPAATGWLIYLPDRGRSRRRPRCCRARDVLLRTEDGLELGAWYVPGSGRDRRAAVLVAPGNAGNRIARALLDP